MPLLQRNGRRPAPRPEDSNRGLASPSRADPGPTARKEVRTSFSGHPRFSGRPPMASPLPVWSTDTGSGRLNRTPAKTRPCLVSSPPPPGRGICVSDLSLSKALGVPASPRDNRPDLSAQRSALFASLKNDPEVSPPRASGRPPRACPAWGCPPASSARQVAGGTSPWSSLHPPAPEPWDSPDPWAAVWLAHPALPQTPGTWGSPGGRRHGTVGSAMLSAQPRPQGHRPRLLLHGGGNARGPREGDVCRFYCLTTHHR